MPKKKANKRRPKRRARTKRSPRPKNQGNLFARTRQFGPASQMKSIAVTNSRIDYTFNVSTRKEGGINYLLVRGTLPFLQLGAVQNSLGALRIPTNDGKLATTTAITLNPYNAIVITPQVERMARMYNRWRARSLSFHYRGVGPTTDTARLMLSYQSDATGLLSKITGTTPDPGSFGLLSTPSSTLFAGWNDWNLSVPVDSTFRYRPDPDAKDSAVTRQNNLGIFSVVFDRIPTGTNLNQYGLITWSFEFEFSDSFPFSPGDDAFQIDSPLFTTRRFLVHNDTANTISGTVAWPPDSAVKSSVPLSYSPNSDLILTHLTPISSVSTLESLISSIKRTKTVPANINAILKRLSDVGFSHRMTSSRTGRLLAELSSFLRSGSSANLPQVPQDSDFYTTVGVTSNEILDVAVTNTASVSVDGQIGPISAIVENKDPIPVVLTGDIKNPIPVTASAVEPLPVSLSSSDPIPVTNPSGGLLKTTLEVIAGGVVVPVVNSLISVNGQNHTVPLTISGMGPSASPDDSVPIVAVPGTSLPVRGTGDCAPESAIGVMNPGLLASSDIFDHQFVPIQLETGNCSKMMPGIPQAVIPAHYFHNATGSHSNAPPALDPNDRSGIWLQTFGMSNTVDDGHAVMLAVTPYGLGSSSSSSSSSSLSS